MRQLESNHGSTCFLHFVISAPSLALSLSRTGKTSPNQCQDDRTSFTAHIEASLPVPGLGGQTTILLAMDASQRTNLDGLGEFGGGFVPGRGFGFGRTGTGPCGRGFVGIVAVL